MKSPVFLAVIGLVIGLFLGGLLTFSFLSQQEMAVIDQPGETITQPGTIASLYDFAPVERVHFNARGEIVEMSDNEIVLEREGSQLKVGVDDNVRIMLFPPPEAIQEGAMVEPQTGSLEDISPGMEINIFGVQHKDGTLVADNITADQR